MVLSGEGADEIFAGYLYFHKAPNPEELHRETVRCTFFSPYSFCKEKTKMYLNIYMIMGTTGLESKGYNCRPKVKANCPLEGKFKPNSLVYKSTGEAVHK